MISKFRRIQDTWYMKGILALTALSFMSLFGIAGYVGGNKNRPVIKVGSNLIYQDQIAMQFEQEVQMAKAMFGDSLEIDETIKTSMLQGIVQRELTNAIVSEASDKYNVRIGDDIIRNILMSQAEFMDESGRFSPSRFRQLLSLSGWSEAKYIDAVGLDVIKQHMVQVPVNYMNAPKALVDKMIEIESQVKVFDYVKVEPKKISVNRKISQEELEQYYQDFNVNFIEPEKRDVSYIMLSLKDMENKVKVNESEIKAYYEANKDKFENAETRNVLQMAFDDKENADKAMAEIAKGVDFVKVAENLAIQSEAETSLGYVSKDMLIADMADAVFGAKSGEVVGPVKSELGWHIMKVNGVKGSSKMNMQTANAMIVAELQKEKAYDTALEVSKTIEDKIGSGATLLEIAGELGANVLRVYGIGEDGKFKKAPSGDASLVKSAEFVDNAFSYNVGEVSQVVETDAGYLVLSVDKIHDSHAKDIELVRGDIEKMWLDSERAAIAQEIVNDISNDLESGDNLPEIAKRFGLILNTTKPLRRSSNFEGLDEKEMLEVFQSRTNDPVVINKKGSALVVASRPSSQKHELSADEVEGIKMKAGHDFTRSVMAQMIDSYGKDFDVRVKYRLLGLAD